VEIQVNIDCADLERMTTFYEAALGYVMHGRAGDQYASMVAADGIGPKLVFQKVPEAKAVKNRVHLDLIVENIEAEAGRFVSLGATRGESFEEFGLHWIVMRDPEGNEVCLCDG
jgi:predicted enzyme related to lactoylglutathione lyase